MREGIAVVAIVAVVSALSAAGLSAEDKARWTRFRGPDAGAVADDPSLPDTWSRTENVAWEIDIPGLSWSSPIVWDDHIFITSSISAGEEETPIRGLYDPGDDNGSRRSLAEHRWMVYAIDFDSGEVVWERELHSAPPPIQKHLKNSFASETPVTDGARVYVYFGSIGLVSALTMSGEVVWTKEIGAFNTTQRFGMAASPVLHNDRLYIVNDNTTESFMVVFDKTTGEEIWRVPRAEGGRNWSTPFIWENDRRAEIVTAGTGGVRAYDLEGDLLWELKGMSGLTIPSPFAKHGLLYISSGYPGGGIRPVYAIRPGASGDISLWPDVENFAARFPGPKNTSDDIAWSYPLLGTYNTSALVYGDYYYTLLDRGFFLCHDAKTGEEIYGRKRLEIGNGFTASPWAYNGKIFLLSEDGDTYVVQAGPEFKVIGKNSLDEMSLATPAVVRGSVILRTQSKLYRLAKPVQDDQS